MHEQTSESYNSFRIGFILKFTKEIIRNTDKYKKIIVNEKVKSFISSQKNMIGNTTEKQNIIKPTKKMNALDLVKEKKLRDSRVVVQSKRFPSIMGREKQAETQQEVNPFKSFSAQGKKGGNTTSKMLRIPETNLPQTVRYLKPIPTPMEIDLKKLNPVIKDPLVRVIECNGSGESIFVTGNMGRKKTPIVLTKEEIDEIISIFSEASKIPTSEGIFKVVYGKLELTAIISEVVGSKFIIKKISFPQQAIPISQRH